MQNTQNTALLVMDMQETILSNLPDAAPFVSTVAMAMKAARAKNIPVITVVVGFRDGAPEISDRNRSFSMAKQRVAQMKPEQWMKVHADVTPEEGEITVTKRRVSAFSGSDLEMILRAQNITHLVLAGIATSGCVLSTLREAADKDYELTVLSDACADPDEEVQRVLMTKVFPRQADVMTVEEWANN